MILATGWFIKNSPIAAPERIDLVPMTDAEYPKTALPPPSVHARRRCILSVSAFIVVGSAPQQHVVLTGVSGPARGILRKIR